MIDDHGNIVNVLTQKRKRVGLFADILGIIGIILYFFAVVYVGLSQ